MGTKDIMLKNYFTPERFADMFNAIVFNGRRMVDPGNVTPWEKETDEGRWCFQAEANNYTGYILGRE